MTDKHALLAQQLARHVGDNAADPAWAALLEAVSQSYAEADAERARLELAARELAARNQQVSAAMRQGALSFWAWDPGAGQLTLQGYAPVGFAEVRGRVDVGLRDLLARVASADRVAVEQALAAVDGEIDVVFQIGDAHRWVRMRGRPERDGGRASGVWADVTDETLGRLDEQRQRDAMARQTRTLRRLAELVVDGGAAPAALAEVAADLCDTLGCAAASVWIRGEDGADLACAVRYEHPAAAVARTPPAPAVDAMVDADAAPARTLARADDADALAAPPPAAGATLDAACLVGRELVGMVRAEDPDRTRRWKPEERAFAASVADGVALAIERQRRGRAEGARAALEEGLRQAQRLEALGQLAAGVAHDLNNLLTPILICGELMRDAVDGSGELRESVDTILTAAADARELVRQLLAFGRKQVLKRGLLDVSAACDRAIKLAARSLPRSIKVELALAADLPPVSADAAQLEQAIVNLALRARDAMPAGGVLSVTTALAATDPGAVEVTIADTGGGIHPQLLPQVFEPFAAGGGGGGGGGGGLGVATAYGIVKQHGGAIAVASAHGRTCFTVRLPAVGAAPACEPAAAGPPLDGSEAVAPATILVVEDEPATLDLVTAALRREGYIVIDAPGPAAAIGLAAMHPGELDLVLTDVVMPEMNGVQMFEQIARHRPRARVVFMSGFGGDGVHGYADAPLLHKPFGVNGLIAAARAALAER